MIIETEAMVRTTAIPLQTQNRSLKETVLPSLVKQMILNRAEWKKRINAIKP